MHATLGKFAAVLFTLSTMAACSNGVPLGPSGAATSPTTNTTTGATPPTTMPVTTTPATPNAPTTTAVAYTPDLQPIFQSDCVPCHGTQSAAGRYSMATYSGVIAAVRAGSASSALVIVTQPGGVMYSFLSGDRATKSALIRTWVLDGAPPSR
jgi:hypothetical protein